MYTKRLVFSCLFVLLLFIALPGLGTDKLSRNPKTANRLPRLKQLQQARTGQSQQTRVRRAIRPQTAIGTLTNSIPQLQPITALAAATKIGFISALQITAGGDPSGTAVTGDFNGDGKRDLATTVYKSSTGQVSISIALGNGDGTFQASKLTTSGANDPYNDVLLVADVNGDYKDDLLLFCEYVTAGTSSSIGKLEVFISNGNGTFSAPVAYTTGAAYVVAASAVDTNADQIPDVMGVSPDGRVITMLNNGNGTFQPPLSTAYAGNLSNAVIADLNGEGKLDFAGFDETTYTYEVFLAAGGGGFQAPLQLPTGDVIYTCSIAAGDLSGDGKPELLTSNCNYLSNNVTIYKNSGDGTFDGGTSLWTGFFTQGLTIADVNGDGKNDVLALNGASGDVTVLLGNGDGTVQPPTQGYAVGGSPWTAPAIADFNGDGKADAVVTDDQFSFVYLQGYGDGTFGAAINYYYGPRLADDSWPNSNSLAQGDLDNDNYPDIVVANSSSTNVGLTVLLNDKNGGLRPGSTLATGEFQYVAIASFHGYFNADIAATSAPAGAPHSVQLFLNNGDGTFQPAKSYPVDLSDPQSMPQGIVAVDLNGDSKSDLVVINLNGKVSVLLNDGQGGFASPVTYALPTGGYQLAVEDMDKDGKLDIVAADFGNDSVEFLRGHGDGTFDAAQSFAVGASPDGIAVADLNGDHNLDIAVAHWDDNTIAVLMGNGNGTFNTPVYYSASLQAASDNPPNAAELRIVDIDGDGYSDLVWENDAYSTVAVLYGNGQGGFTGPVEFPTGSAPWGLVVADVNLDGAPDVVTSNNDMLGATVLLNAGGNTMQGTVTPNPAQLGQTITLAATVTGTVKGVAAIPTGTVAFDLDGTSLGTATLVNGNASVDASSLAAGSYKALARYSGDKLFRPQSISISFSVVKLTTTSIASSINPSMENNPVTFTATVTPAGTGTVTFKDGTTALATPVTLDANGKATFTTSSLSAGTHSVSAVYGGDLNYAGSTSVALSQVIKGPPGSTTTALTSSTNPSIMGHSVTFTAAVTSTTNGAITGTVTFKDGTAFLGTGTLDANGKATLSTTSLTAATHTITAVYAGDANYATSTGAALAQIVLASAPDYTLAANPTTINIATGQSGTSAITATAGEYFNGTVSLTCGTVPVGVTCQFNPPSLTPTYGNPAQSTLTVRTTAQVAALELPASPASPVHGTILLATLGGIGVLGGLITGNFPKRKRFLLAALFGVMAFVMVLGFSGCGGGGSQTTATNPTNPNATPLGQSTVLVSTTATAGTTGGNTAAHSLALTINVSK